MGKSSSYRVFNSGSNSHFLVLEGSSSGQNRLQTGKFRSSLNPSSAPFSSMFQLHTSDNTDDGLTVKMEISCCKVEVTGFPWAGWEELCGKCCVCLMVSGRFVSVSVWHTSHTASNPIFWWPWDTSSKPAKDFYIHQQMPVQFHL